MRAIEHPQYNKFLIDLPGEAFDNESTTDIPQWFLDKVCELRAIYTMRLIDKSMLIPLLMQLRDDYLRDNTS
jgi:hypothetical protein